MQNYLEANKSIYPVGCADRAVMWIEAHLLLVGALALGLALPQVNPTHALTSRRLCTNWHPALSFFALVAAPQFRVTVT